MQTKLARAAALAALVLPAMLALPAAPGLAAGPIRIIAAENFYGEVAEAVGGDRVAVESVIVAAGTDPHDFEPPPSVARAVADAGVVILNGAGYDHWMERLAEASAAPGRVVIEVAGLVGAHEGDNPHLWYDPRAVPALAQELAIRLAAIDPGNTAEYTSRANVFVASLDPLSRKIADLRERYAGTPVTASEPVFGPMAAALGLDMRHASFQQAIMNETEPSAADIAAMESDLKSGRVRVLFYNSQVVDPLTEQLLAAAKAGGVPVVAVTETRPDGKTYRDWMLDQLDAAAKALAAPAS